MSGLLYIVSTPIGNLNDMTDRAKHTLAHCQLVAAEDTRVSKKLLQHFGISTPLMAFHDFSNDKAADALLEKVESGQHVALISDAGTPLISDPGFVLVKKAHDRSIRVVPIPGASALTTAVSVSGLPTHQFSFLGFLPPKQSQRVKALVALNQRADTLIFYEAPHRIVDSLADMVDVFGAEREACLARELTKTFETLKKAPLVELLEWVSLDSNQRKGEIVVVVEGAQAAAQQESLPDEAKQLAELLMNELPPKKASQIIASFYSLPKRAIYDFMLSLKQ